MTLMLLDSASLWYRAYYGMPDTLLAPDGTSVNAIRGYVDMTARLMNVYKPDRLVACLDGDWRPSWRVDIFPEYKANRLEEEGGEEEEEPETLTLQIPMMSWQRMPKSRKARYESLRATEIYSKWSMMQGI